MKTLMMGGPLGEPTFEWNANWFGTPGQSSATPIGIGNLFNQENRRRRFVRRDVTISNLAAKRRGGSSSSDVLSLRDDTVDVLSITTTSDSDDDDNTGSVSVASGSAISFGHTATCNYIWHRCLVEPTDPNVQVVLYACGSAVGSTFVLASAGAARYIAPVGGIESTTNETLAQIKFKVPGTVQKVRTYVDPLEANDHGTTVHLRSRIAGVTGNIDVQIPVGGLGTHEDTINSDHVDANVGFCFQGSDPGTGSTKVSLIEFEFVADVVNGEHDLFLSAAGTTPGLPVSGVPLYFPPGGWLENAGGTTNETIVRATLGMDRGLKWFRAVVTTNSCTEDQIFTVIRYGSPTELTFTIPAGETGEFAAPNDVIIAISAAQTFSYAQSGGGSGSLGVEYLAVTITLDEEVIASEADCASSGFDLRYPPCVTTFTQCVKISRRDGVAFRFTSLDQDIEFRGETYVTCGGLDPMATQTTAQLGEVGSSELGGLIVSTGIEEHELYCGLFDDAFVEIWLVDYEGTERPRRLAAGWSGKITHSTRGYRMEVLGPGARLEQRPIVQVYSPQCRWVFGDERCGVDIEALGINGVVLSGLNRGAFLADFGSLAAGIGGAGGIVAPGGEGYIFDTIEPLSELWVDPTGNDANIGTQASPLLTIQEAIDRVTPGTAIYVNAGSYTGPVQIPASKSGTATAPCWLISINGQAVDGGSYATVALASTSQSVIAIQGADNWAIVGFRTDGGERGIFVATSGGATSANILITGNETINASDDGIKCNGQTSSATSAENVNVIRNRARNCGGEGIDYVHIAGGVISYNEVHDCDSTAAGIFAKAGSDGTWIHHNDVHDIPNGDGISAGGQSVLAATFAYHLANGILEHNHVENVDQNPFIAMGAVDTTIRHNYSDSGSYNPNIQIRHGNHNGVPLYSRDVEVTGNLLLGSTTVQTLSGNTSNVHDNFTDPGDFDEEPYGPSVIAPFAIGGGSLSSGEISSGGSISSGAFSTGGNLLTGQFANGRVRWLTGVNEGQVNEIKTVETGTGQIVLWALTCHVPQSGDTFRLLPGCMQDFATCQNEYDNAINFGGFPHVPGRDAIMESPNAKNA